MSQQYRLKLHSNGPALWPEHKGAAEVSALKATTPEPIWEATYQGNPTPPGGSVFKREWFRGCRYDAGDRALVNRVVGRWLSWDTALKDTEGADYSALAVGELLPDYRLVMRRVIQARWEFPDLPAQMEAAAREFNRDLKLRGVLIEDRASGTSAYQTLAATSPAWLRELLAAFNPTVDKVSRANQAAVWCRNGCVLLPSPLTPLPGDEGNIGWLLDFEDQFFTFPGAAHDDMVDAFSQLILYLENLLAEGWRARQGI